MENVEPTTSPDSSVEKNKFLKTNLPLIIGATVLIGSSFMLGTPSGFNRCWLRCRCGTIGRCCSETEDRFGCCE